MDCQKHVIEYSFYIVTNTGLGFAHKPIDKKIHVHISNIQKY